MGWRINVNLILQPIILTQGLNNFYYRMPMISTYHYLETLFTSE